MTALALYEGKTLDLIRRTVCKDANDDELNQFIHICRATRLDPLRRQAYCFVFNKDKPQWRQMTVVTAIGGYRSIAERTGNYRPDDSAPRIEYSDSAKDPKTNPLGIVRCEVKIYKRSHGEWFPVVGEAYWDEYVPLKDGAIDPKKTGWIKMPRIMIAKCAEANALRKAWPDDFAGLEVEEEIDRRTIELTATELADAAAIEGRVARLGGPGVLVDWCDGEPLQHVPNGKFVDAFMAFSMQHKDDPERVVMWGTRNAAAINQFWTTDKNGALAVKRVLEGIAKLVAA